MSLNSRRERYKEEEEEVPVAENDNVEGSRVRVLELLVCRFTRRILRLRAVPSGTLLDLRTTNVERFRGGLVFKAHRVLCHSSLGSSVIKRRRKYPSPRMTMSKAASYAAWSCSYVLGSERNLPEINRSKKSRLH